MRTNPPFRVQDILDGGNREGHQVFQFRLGGMLMALHEHAFG